MNKVKRVKNKDYTIISNVFLKDKDLSIKAKGFLAVVMGLPEEWEFSIKGICAILKEGKSAVYSVIDELKEKGYCTVSNERDGGGLFAGNDYTFYEEPHTEEPHTENRDTDNRTQLNTNRIKETFNKELNNIKQEEDEFVERMYAMYPSTCPKRGTSLGKSRKDKERIRKLLKTYSMDEIESVFKREIEEKYDKHYMQNLSTFLNNFPDPHSEQGCLFVGTDVGSGTDNTDGHLFINGVIYR